MELDCINYLESTIKKEVIGNSRLITVDEIQQKIHARFCIEYSKEEIKELLLKKAELFEIKEDSFVCKIYFTQFFEKVKNEENTIKKINRHYFIKLSELEAKRLLNEKEVVKEENTEYTITAKVNHDKEKEIPKVIKTERQFEPYEILGTHRIKYEVDEIIKIAIDFMLKNQTSLKLNSLEESKVTSEKEIKEIIKFGPSFVSEKLIRKNKLFYIASKKNIFFKPLLGALIINKNNKIVPYVVIENLLIKKMKSQSINRKELSNYLKENNKVFKVHEKSVEILCTLDEYIENIKMKYGANISNKEQLKKLLGRNTEEVSKELEIPEDDLTITLNKKKQILVSEGEIKKLEEVTLKSNFIKLIGGMEFIDKKVPEKFTLEQTEKILLSLLKKKPLNIDEIKEELWLYKNKISEDKIDMILKNSLKFKKVDFYRYIDSKNLKYATFKNNFALEIESITKNLKDSEKKIFALRLIERKTLEAVAKYIGITRQRVRQIAVKLEPKFKKFKFKTINNYLNLLDDIFEKNKVLKEYELEKEIRRYRAFDNLKINYIVKIYEFFREKSINIYFDKYYSLIEEKNIYENLNKITDKVITLEEFREQFNSLGIKSDLFINDYIANMNENICLYKEMILYSKRKNYREGKIQMIFEVEGRELKINELTDLYNTHYNQNMRENSLGNVLLDSQKFTRVFTGTYRLTKWGGEEHIYTRDLAVKYLKKKRRPVSIDEILENTSDKTRANDTTIRMFTSMSDETFAYSHGEWALKEWSNDSELSKKYHISKNRIEASKENVVQVWNKGSFTKNNKLASLHLLNKRNIVGNGGLNLGRRIPYKFFSEISLRYKNLKYVLEISDRDDGVILKGIAEPLLDIGVKDEMYFYLVYLNSETIRIYTWDEFENEEFYRDDDIVLEPVKIPIETIEETPPTKPDESEPKIWTYEMVLKKGLSSGQVKSAWIESIDFDEEDDVEDYYEAKEALEKKEIIII